ncbi:MAG: hypothetical protein OSB38_30495 [Paraburkholderia fungorum]|nr:hypothetical protein [Paraburkholderia fungorum]
MKTPSTTRTAIQSSWEIFERRSVPEEATPEQRREYRRTFFAGFHTMLYLQQQLVVLEPAHANAVLDSVAAEAADFAAEPY